MELTSCLVSRTFLLERGVAFSGRRHSQIMFQIVQHTQTRNA